MQCAALMRFFVNDAATTEIYTRSLHDALPIWRRRRRHGRHPPGRGRRRGRERWADAPVARYAPRLWTTIRLPTSREGGCRASAREAAVPPYRGPAGDRRADDEKVLSPVGDQPTRDGGDAGGASGRARRGRSA